ncbi:MAG: MBL fold metallo-hydrolase [Candidatus Zixiibacteriota bacterium]|nr:MAG: MBL fold metallo-hydrolase [candidate division Zixibacteria bacterium]
MKITIIYDNESQDNSLKPDWGFSCLIEYNGINLLFDTGSNGALLLKNMKELGIDPISIDEIFISHSHFDHSGGLSSFLNENGQTKIYAPDPLRGISPAREVIYVDESIELSPQFYTTGMLFNMEQSLAIKTEKGLVIVVGCSHPGVENILKAVTPFGTPYALVGGLHGFREFDVLNNLQHICPTHCTQYISEIKSLYPGKYIRGGVGEIIEI